MPRLVPLALIVLLAAALVAVGRAVWWSAAGPPGAAPLEGPLEGPRSEVVEEEDVAAGHSPRREDVTPEPASDASAARSDELLLRCVEAGGGAPVPHASVHVLAESPAAERPIQTRARPFAAIRSEGEEHRADERGELRLPPAVTRRWVAAQAEGLRGWTALDLPALERTVELELSPPRELVVHLRDASGEPVAGVEARVGVLAERAADELPQEVARTESAQSTGAAVFEAARLTSWKVWSLWERAYAEAVVVAEEPPRVVFPSRPLPDGPLLLELPAHGRVQLEVRDAAGALLPGRHEVALRALPDGRRVVRELERGHAVFEQVATGLELETARKGGVVATPPAFRGPLRPGDAVLRVLRLEQPLVTGRAVDAGGSPLRAAALSVENPSGDGRARLATDGEGGFALSLPAWIRRTEEADGVELLLREVDTPGRPARSASVALPPPTAGGVRRMGDGVLREPAALVSGLVRGDAGEPIPAATVFLRDSAPPRARIVESVLTDAAGRFAFADVGGRGAGARAGELTISASASGHATGEARGFEPAEHITLTLQQLGAVLVRIEHAGQAAPEGLLLRTHPDDRGTWSFARAGEPRRLELPPGRWDLALHARDHPALPPLALARDPRLDPWVVRARTLELSVIDVDGRPVEQGSIRVHAQGLGAGTAMLDAASLSLPVPDVAVDVEVTAPGHAAGSVRGALGRVVVPLGPAPSVRLQVHGDRASLPPDARLALRLRRRTSLPVETPAATAAKLLRELPGELDFEELAAAGAWEVELSVYGEDRHPCGVVGALEVAPGAGAQRFELELPAAAIEEARRALEHE